MTLQQKMSFFAWCNKYGIPLVCLSILYVDFVRPLKNEHTTFLNETLSLMKAQTTIMQRVADNQEALQKAVSALALEAKERESTAAN